MLTESKRTKGPKEEEKGEGAEGVDAEAKAKEEEDVKAKADAEAKEKAVEDAEAALKKAQDEKAKAEAEAKAKATAQLAKPGLVNATITLAPVSVTTIRLINGLLIFHDGQKLIKKNVDRTVPVVLSLTQKKTKKE